MLAQGGGTGGGGTGGTGGDGTGGTGGGTGSTTLSAFSTERAISSQGFQSSMNPAFAPNVAASIQAGALEIRQGIAYNPTLNTLTIREFLVAPGSPLPTPSGVDVSANLLQQLNVNVDRVYVTTTPVRSILMVGTIGTGATGGTGSGSSGQAMMGPFGNLAGLPVAVSVRYSDAATPTLSDMVVVIAGTVTTFTRTAAGSLTLPGSGGTGGGGTGGGGTTTGPTIVVRSGGNTLAADAMITTDQVEVELDASGSTGAETYSWRFVQKTGVITPSNASRVRVLFSEGAGDYIVELTAMGGGQTATRRITIRNVRTLPF
jgi:hypothetical protein